MAANSDSRWFFALEQVQNSPSRRAGLHPDQELFFRQKAAYLIQSMGQTLKVPQLCINTAIVYMHRFYMFHTFANFHFNGVAAASLFLASKVEEQYRRTESIIQVLYGALGLKTPATNSSEFKEQVEALIDNENILLQTFGFDVTVEHPHIYVLDICQLIKADQKFTQTSYYLASNSLQLTTMCLKYRLTEIACFCVHLAGQWSRWQIPPLGDGKFWFQLIDESVTMETLEQMTYEFLTSHEKKPKTY